MYTNNNEEKNEVAIEADRKRVYGQPTPLARSRVRLHASAENQTKFGPLPSTTVDWSGFEPVNVKVHWDVVHANAIVGESIIGLDLPTDFKDRTDQHCGHCSGGVRPQGRTDEEAR